MESSKLSGLSLVVDWLACPACRCPVGLDGMVLACERGHRFDVARQGHVNLALRAAPRNADTADMVAARDRFLTAGWYHPLTEALTRALAGCSRVAEFGAGTAHHLRAHLEAHPDAVGLATDVSPAACRRAARQHNRLGVVVADTWAGLPVRDDMLDAVVCIFAPRNPGEFERVLAPGGLLAVVTPTPGHLAELRDGFGLLGVEPEKLHRLDHSLSAFSLLHRLEITFPLHLTAEGAHDLVRMGPNAFHDHRLPTEITTNAAFTLSLYTVTP
ncbi:MAG: SAM-dependent methyltransferase [Propionibacteriaceae bacterium]|nr:SAM-dependent methyltransferase [Propionibacteriaceae bacterium]